MKLKHPLNLTQPQISKHEVVHPSEITRRDVHLIRPNPPTAEAVANAQFIDKTYIWKKK